VQEQLVQTSEPAESWERLDGESARAFEAFGLYRDLGPQRSLAKVRQELGKSRGLLERWSSRHAWVQRAALWDGRADRLRRERDEVERAERRREMLERHAHVGVAMTKLAAARLEDLEPGSLRAADAARLGETGARLERSARGELGALVSAEEVRRFVDGLIEVALGFVPEHDQDPFLVAVGAMLGVGGSA
jgi:hypothetical protein